MVSGFIHIDCGIPANSNYTDSATGINYVSDSGFTEAGESKTILPIYRTVTPALPQEVLTLRSFPQGTRNCYTLKPVQGRGHGTPFISSLDLRYSNNSYYSSEFGSLYLYARLDYGGIFAYYRYKDDIYDRLWNSFDEINTSSIYDFEPLQKYAYDGICKVPSEVMRSAITPDNTSNPLKITWEPRNASDQFLIYLHFAEVQTLKRNQTREFNVYLNGNLMYNRPVIPINRSTGTGYSTEPEERASNYEIIFQKTNRSTLPPIINALELFTVKQFLQSQTDDQDAGSIMDIKSVYTVQKENWQGDPCAPRAYAWDGVGCSYNDSDFPRIISLNLSSSGLSGKIVPSLSNLTMLKSLDLSNNNLSGEIPDFLSQLTFLRILFSSFNSPIKVKKWNFNTKAKLLMSIHHKNLTALVGYCNEDNHLGIIYEYMANGDLEGHLAACDDRQHLNTGKKSDVLTWEQRILIATDAAEGFEYLHHGCKPPIIHRDVKSTNILLTENFQGKLADFGLSRVIPFEAGSHVTTVVAGTPGYLDPQYYRSNRLTEKSDVYSFGIVLLEIITGRPAVGTSDEHEHIVEWVRSGIEKGDVRILVDLRIRGNVDANSVWKALEIALACVSLASDDRPTMNFVASQLKECLATELQTRKKELVGGMSLNLDSDVSSPQARCSAAGKRSSVVVQIAIGCNAEELAQGSEFQVSLYR
ncbi:hypothetical protein AgCh_006700 [Apium graveolens]